MDHPAYTRILVPLDGSPRSEAVLPHAQRLARAATAEIVLLHVLVDPAPEFDDAATSALRPPPAVRDEQRQFTAYMKSTCARLERAGSCVTYLVRHGAIPQTIIDVARFMKADLIAMSTHGRTGMSRLLLGSVAERVVHDATIPVLLFRPPPDQL